MKQEDRINSLNEEHLPEQSSPHHNGDAPGNPEALYRTLFENSDSATMIIEENLTISLANTKFEELSGYSKAEVEGKLPWTIAIHPDDVERMTTYHRVRRERPDAVPHRYDFRIRDKQGRTKDIYASVAMIPGTRKSVASLTDITDLKKTERELRKLSLAVEASSDWVLMTDGNGSIEYVNNAVLDLSGYSREELIGQNPRIFSSGETDPVVYKQMWNTLRAGWPFQAILTNRRKNGELYEIFHSITPLMDEDGEITNFITSSKDLTQMKLLDDRLNYLANYDGLTGMPNQTLLLDRIKLEIPRGEFRKRLVAVLALDIDRLFFISKTLGSEYADAVLRKVGQRLTSVVRKGDTVARLGRDKFAVLLVDMAQSEDLLLVIREIFNKLKPALTINDTDLVVAVHIGISLAPQDTVDAAELVKNAETALSKSREQGLNTYQFFTEDMNHRASTVAQFQKSLFHALKNNEFELYYQPYFDVHSRKIAGMEALIRWNSPEHGFVTPAQFIPVLEETRMIADVGKWVVREACRQIKVWQDKGYAMVPVTTNLSAVQFRETDLGDVLEEIIWTSGIDTKFLAFELTESTLVQKPEQIRVLMSRLKSLGCTISIDDFGTGYSSLSYLKNLPADNLKIDISFIREIVSNADDAAIVSSIVSLAHNLRLKTIAEGVETEEQLKILHMLRCDMVQGYYFSKPVPAGTVETMLPGK
jgi:diguanylate cyclase (GGDEF)-like protein/PAS domain S-box-containing protein